MIGRMIFSNPLVLLVFMLAEYLLPVLGLMLQLGTLIRVERIPMPAWVYRLAFGAVLASLMLGTLNFVLLWYGQYRTVIDPILVYADWLVVGIKSVALVLCLFGASRLPALIIIATGILIDVAATASLLWTGGTSADDLRWGVLGWGIIYFGMARLARQIKTRTWEATSAVPLWIQVESPMPRPTEEIRWVKE